MTYKFVIIIIVVGFLMSCSDDYTDLMIPDEICIDVNDDGTDDLKIQYNRINIDDLPFEGDRDTFTFDRSVICNILPIDENESLLFQEPDGWKYPQLTSGDTIFSTYPLNPLGNNFWGGKRSGNLMIINRLNEIENWEEDWSYWKNQFDTNSPYIGFRINSNNEHELCWIKLNLSISSGEVQIFEKKCIKSDLIIVGE